MKRTTNTVSGCFGKTAKGVGGSLQEGKAGHHKFTIPAGGKKGMRVSFRGLHHNA